MSYKLVDLIFDVPGLTQGEQSVLVAICRYADNATHDCYPSRELIAKVARIQVRQVQRVQPALIDKGYITYTAGKGRAPNQYTVQVAYLKSLITSEDIKPPQENEDEDASRDIKTPQGDSVVGTLTQSCEDICSSVVGTSAQPVGTFAQASGDICSTLYIEESVKESVSESVKESVTLIGSAKREAKKTALSMNAMLEQLTPGALGELAVQIAIRHPRSRLRNWTEFNVSQADTVAILEAMENEAQLNHVTMAEAGRMMLALLDAWDDLPREKWQYAAAIPRFYKQGDYRLQPHELPGMSPQEGRNHGKRSSSRGTEGNAEALQQFVAAELERQQAEDSGDSVVDGHAGATAGPEDNPGHGEGVRGDAGGVDAAGDSSGVFEGARRVQVLPKPSYPPRIQWPRRNG